MLNKLLGNRMKPSTLAKVKSYGVAIIGIVGIVAIVVATDGNADKKHKEQAEVVNIVTSSNSRALGLDAVRGISKDAQRKTFELETEFEKLKEDNAKLLAELKTSTTLARELKKTQEQLDKLRTQQKASEESFDKRVKTAIDTAVNDSEVKKILNVNREQIPKLNSDHDPYADKSQAAAQESKLPVPQRRITAPNGGFSYGEPATKSNGDSVAAARKVTPNGTFDLRGNSLFKISEVDLSLDGSKNIKESQEIYLPKTSILTGVILTGLDAPTHKGAQESPYPVLVRIKKEAVLANFKVIREVNECFALMSGYGDLSTERAMLRGEGITCVKKDGTVIERKMSGYAAGEDSKAGIKGTLVTRNSTILVNAMMAGFASGMSSAFNVTPTPTYTTNDDGTVNYADIFTPKAGQGALASGASHAMEKLADYYMELANQMHPVIEVGAGRVIDIVLTEGTDLGVAKL